MSGSQKVPVNSSYTSFLLVEGAHHVPEPRGRGVRLTGSCPPRVPGLCDLPCAGQLKRTVSSAVW